MSLKVEIRQDNLAGGLKGLVAGVGTVVEWWRQWWWWCTAPMNKHPRPARVIRLPVLQAIASKAAKKQFNYSWKGRGTCLHCTFMCTQHWQQIEPRSVKVQMRLLKYMSMSWRSRKKLNQQEYTYESWCWHWVQWRQQGHRREIGNEQDDRVTLIVLRLLKAKWPESMWEGMLLIWRKKESKTVKKPKIIDLKSLGLPSLSVTELDQSMKPDE